mmetsp:Transcript_97032/g.182486  ORF Transcript_97032/g.182486 Transcript_97032/m.182486 type:complete len:890 (+) Transcript_97032:67-2736(+)
MALGPTKFSCAAGFFLLVSSVALQRACAAWQAPRSDDLPVLTCDSTPRARVEGAAEVTSASMGGLDDGTSQEGKECVPAFYFRFLRWTKVVACTLTGGIVLLLIGVDVMAVMRANASLVNRLSLAKLPMLSFLYPTFALILWLMVTLAAAVAIVIGAFISRGLLEVVLSLAVGSGVTSLLAAALLLHLQILESMPTLLSFFYYQHRCAFVFTCVGLGAAAFAFSYQVVMRKVHFAANANTKKTIAVCVAPVCGCFLCCTGMSVRPFCEYIPFWFLIVTLTIYGKNGFRSFLAAQLFAVVGWHLSPQGSLLRALLVGFVDVEPLLVFTDLVCELAVVQFWRTGAVEKIFASLALSAAWAGLAVCGRLPAPAAIFYRCYDLRELFIFLMGKALGGCSQDWAPDKYMRAMLTIMACITFLFCCLRPNSRGQRILNEVNVRICNADLEKIVGPESSALLRPILRRMPTARTMKRLSDFPDEARAKRRRIGDAAPHLSPEPASVVSGLCSVRSAAELRQVLNQLTHLASTKETRTWYLKVRRSHLISDALALFSEAREEDLLAAQIKVAFQGEFGMDHGGVKRDFFTSVANALKSGEYLVEGPDQCLLPKPSPAGGTLGLHVDELRRTYMAIGRFVAVALLQKQQVPLDFSHLAFKILLGREVTAHDIKAVDPEFFQHRIKMLLEDDGVQKMEAILMDELYFMSAETRMRPVAEPLKSGGERLRVTEENKFEYIRLLCQSYVLGGLHEQIQAMRHGFYHVLPLDVLRELNINELDLGLMLAGIPVIDVGEWKAHTRQPRGHDQLKKWFWEIVAEFDNVQRALLLAFATGAARVPPGGFAEMHFKLELDPRPEHLPTAHTCANMLKIPVVTSKEALRQKLDTVLSVSDYAAFGFA